MTETLAPPADRLRDPRRRSGDYSAGTGASSSCTGSTRSPRMPGYSSFYRGEPPSWHRRIRASAPRRGPRFRDRLRPRPPLLELLDALPDDSHAHRAFVRRLARGRDRGDVPPSARPARPRRRARHQGQRPRDARHPGRLQHRAAGGAAAELARSRHVGAGLRRHVGRGARRCARNWEALCLYGWHPYMYNPQLKRWLRPHHACRRSCCGAPATAS